MVIRNNRSGSALQEVKTCRVKLVQLQDVAETAGMVKTEDFPFPFRNGCKPAEPACGFASDRVI